MITKEKILKDFDKFITTAPYPDEVKQFISASIDSLLQEILSEMPKDKSHHWGSEMPSRNWDNGVDTGFNECRQEVINIINSHR